MTGGDWTSITLVPVSVFPSWLGHAMFPHCPLLPQVVLKCQ